MHHPDPERKIIKEKNVRAKTIKVSGVNESTVDRGVGALATA